MPARKNDNQVDSLDEVLTRFVNACEQDEHPDIDELVEQYPQYEAHIRRRIGGLREIDALFDSLVQTDESDFADAVPEPDLVGRTIGNFQIVKMIGRGGMGVVYLARDTKLNRSVAVKSIPANLADDATARIRFRREAELLASLNHPNIAVIYEILEQDKSGYLILEYVPGETLTQRMAREPFTVEQALSIGQQIAQAISAAHKRGIVHRDLKPGNIKITPDGRVKVLDFGLAKAPIAEGKSSDITVTQSGHVIGTPAYMSPEQARGESTDHRTDIWSFGCIIYQMLTGQLPFEGRTATDTLARVIEREPDWKLLPEETPADIRTLLHRCLEKDLNKRLDNITDATVQISDTLSKPIIAPAPAVTSGLRKVTMIVGAAIIIILLAVVLRLLPENQAQLSPKEIRLVVLPFENLGPVEAEWFTDTMTDEITTRLVGIRPLAVIARQSAFAYKNKKIPARQIAKELSIDYMIRGTIQCELPSDPNEIARELTPDPNTPVRIRVQLVRAVGDKVEWADSYDGDMYEILTFQSDIAEGVAQALDMTLLEPERQTLASKPTENTEAYVYYMRGKEYHSDSEDDLKRAIEMYEISISLDPDYAQAYAALSSAHTSMYWLYYDRSEERLAKAEKAARRALELDPDLSEARLALGRYYLAGRFDYDSAYEQFAIVLKSYPNHVRALASTGSTQKRQGKFEEALVNLKRAYELNPASTFLPDRIAHTLRFLRRYEEEQRCLDRLISLAPDIPRNYVKKAESGLLWQGDIDKARAILDDARVNTSETAEGFLRIHDLDVTLDIYSRNYREALNKLLSKPQDFDDMVWFIPNDLRLAEVYRYLGDEQLAQHYYQSAVAILEEKVAEDPNDCRFHSALGKAYAGLGGREQDAVDEGKLGVKYRPVEKDAHNGPLHLDDLARIYVMVGKYDEAIDILQRLLSMPSELTVPWLRLDPIWDPLRDHSRFNKLLERGNSLKEIQPSTKEIRLVVLPFDNLGPSNDEWFADGITDEITSRLAGLHGLGVISRQSAIQYKNKEKSTPQIAQELDVDYILQGTIQRENPSDPNSRVRIRCQLIRTADDTHVWTEQYDNHMREVLTLQSQVAEKVAQALDLTLLEPERTLLASRPTENTEAFNLYLESQDYARRYDLENRREIAIGMLKKAIELDPNFTLAYARLSHLCTSMYWFHEDRSEERLIMAEQAARKALELDPELPESHVAMARYYYQGHLDFDNALKHLAFVRKRYPNYGGMLYWTGSIRKRQGKFQLAVDNLEKGFELNPLSYDTAAEIGLNYLLMRNYPKSEYYCNKAISLAPHMAGLYSMKAWLYLCWDGDTDRARRAVEDGLQKSSDTQNDQINTMLITIDIFEEKYQEALNKLFLKPENINELDYFIPYDLRCALVYMFMDNTESAKKHFEEAQIILEDKIKQQPEDDRYYSALGITYAGLGRHEDAIVMGQKGAKELPFTEDGSRAQSRHEDLARIFTMIGDFDAAIDKLEFLLKMDGDLSVSLLRLDPAWKPLRNHPRFQKLVESYK
jgi:serine/threonine protein kinase/TolB-like protein/Tfp pilus assembly protein PilF